MKYTILILLVLIPSITTLQCYVCNSLENTDCGDSTKLATNFEKLCATNTTSGNAFCRKIDQTINGQKSVVRSCGFKAGAKACYKTAGANSANVCTCEGDLCNHAAIFTRQQQGIMTIFCLAITMIFLR